MTTPLLEEEDEKGNEKTNKISFSKESFLPTQAIACFTFFNNGSFNLGDLVNNDQRILRLTPKVGQILEGFLIPTDRSKPSWRFLAS